MEQNNDNEIYLEENHDGHCCIKCGKFFTYNELYIHNDEINFNEYICLKCSDVFQD